MAYTQIAGTVVCIRKEFTVCFLSVPESRKVMFQYFDFICIFKCYQMKQYGGKYWL